MILSNFINKKYLEKKNIILNIKYLKNCEKVKVLVLDDFLQSEFMNSILSDLKNENKKIVSLGLKENNIKYSYYIGDNLAKLNYLFNSYAFKKFLSLFFGYELEFFNDDSEIKNGIVLQDNTFLEIDKWHTDYMVKGKIKKLGNVLLYLSDTYREGYGGELELGELNNGIIEKYEKIYPKSNRFILLISEENKSFHKIGHFLKEYQRIVLVKQVLNKS